MISEHKREAIDNMFTIDWLQKHLKLLLLFAETMGGLKLLFPSWVLQNTKCFIMNQ